MQNGKGGVRHPNAPVVVTVLEPKLRGEVDLATYGVFATVHTSSIADAMEAVRDHTVRALLLSPQMLDDGQIPSVNRLLSGLPGVATVAVVAERAQVPSDRLLALGACGVKRMVDLKEKQGWSDLRSSLETDCSDIAVDISRRLGQELATMSRGTQEFFTLLVRHAADTTSVKSLAVKMELKPSTLVSRFYRPGLPSVRRYLCDMRLMFASAHMSASAVSIAAVARRLNYSSPQSFGRHVYIRYRVPAGTFRRTYPFDRMVTEYVEDLVSPYRPTFAAFNPFG